MLRDARPDPGTIDSAHGSILAPTQHKPHCSPDRRTVCQPKRAADFNNAHSEHIACGAANACTRVGAQRHANCSPHPGTDSIPGACSIGTADAAAHTQPGGGPDASSDGTADAAAHRQPDGGPNAATHSRPNRISYGDPNWGAHCKSDHHSDGVPERLPIVAPELVADKCGERVRRSHRLAHHGQGLQCHGGLDRCDTRPADA